MSSITKGKKARRRILIVDDHPMMREGLAQLIDHEKDLEVCGQAADAAQAMSLAAGTHPDLVLADISLPGRSGLELTKDLLALYPNLPILVISMHDETLYAERVLRAGGRGYIMKHEGGLKLMGAIRQVLAGRVYVSEHMSAQLLDSLAGGKSDANQPSVHHLTDRELEVFRLLGNGIGSRDIAARLNLSVKTVEVHRAHIKRKLGKQTSVELIRDAVRWVESQGRQ